MCKDYDIASADALEALDNVMVKISTQAKGQFYTNPRQDLWLPVPDETISKGYMKMMGLGVDENGWNYMQIKIHPNTETVIHYHKNMIERFVLIKGSFGFKVFDNTKKQNLIREGTLTKIGQSETISPGEWHLVLSSLIETYVVIIYKTI